MRSRNDIIHNCPSGLTTNALNRAHSSARGALCSADTGSIVGWVLRHDGGHDGGVVVVGLVEVEDGDRTAGCGTLMAFSQSSTSILRAAVKSVCSTSQQERPSYLHIWTGLNLWLWLYKTDPTRTDNRNTAQKLCDVPVHVYQ